MCCFYVFHPHASTPDSDACCLILAVDVGADDAIGKVEDQVDVPRAGRRVKADSTPKPQ